MNQNVYFWPQDATGPRYAGMQRKEEETENLSSLKQVSGLLHCIFLNSEENMIKSAYL